jgi:shikimate kinase
MTDKSIFFCGFMGCGKTSLGRLMAGYLGIPFIDLDRFIEMKSSSTVREIFEQGGEEAFRQLETIAVAFLCGEKSKGHIIALGGGTIISELNAGLINRYGVCVFIDVDFQTCYERVKNDTGRPLVQNNSKEQLEQLFHERRKIYLANSRFVIKEKLRPLDFLREFLKIYGGVYGDL